MSTQPEDPSQHPFVRAPHRTVMSLSFWVLVSILAEPLTGLVDTAFVSRLGAAPLAALGIGATVLGSMFWVFNFLQIGTQTETGNFLGQGNRPRARELCVADQYRAHNPDAEIRVLVYDTLMTHVGYMEKPRQLAGGTLAAVMWLYEKEP